MLTSLFEEKPLRATNSSPESWTPVGRGARHESSASFPRKRAVMGNCMEKCALRQRDDEEVLKRPGDGVEIKEGGCKVKILLTRGELERLLLQLKEKGERTLEDVLMEIERERKRGRERAEGWKPSLESIVEGPEVQRFDVMDS